MVMDRIERYQSALNLIPPPGTGCHPTLLSVANYGVMAGLDGERILRDILEHIPYGQRRISGREITEAINKAMDDRNRGAFIPKIKPALIISDGQRTLEKLIGQGIYSEAADLLEASPIRLWGTPEKDYVLFIETLFAKNDLIWIGDRYDSGIMGKTIRTASEWIRYFSTGGSTAPHIVLNPLTGTPAPTKNGYKKTLRGDGNISVYRYCLVEFDNLSREDQIRFWSAIKLPICALIDSGGKSIHAWIDVQKLVKVETPAQWQAEIKERLYDRILTPMGVDSACSNPARLSRLPGHFRQEKGAYQRLLWLSPEGRYIQ
jgi:hypothetical protein